MPVVKGICEYDGTNYSGWQKQINSNSIQEEIEKALSIILSDKISIIGAGRTDTGVHALNQVFHFKVSAQIDLNSLKKSINGILPSDISVKSLSFENDNFHARYSVKRRTYLYRISRRKSVFCQRYCWTIYGELNINSLFEIQNLFLGKKEFTSFCKAESEVKNKICTVYFSRWFSKGDFLLYFISANRFIHGMVRGIVGLSIEYAKGNLALNDVKNIIDGYNRCPIWAPSNGLILYQINY